MPSLQLWAPNYYGKPIETVMNLVVCDEHKIANVDEWVTDKGWEQICEGIAAAGYVVPERARTRIIFKRINSQQVQLDIARLKAMKSS